MTGWNFILIGLCLVITGVLVILFPHMKLPVLPGDILIRNKEGMFYFPVVSSIVVSIILTIIFTLFR